MKDVLSNKKIRVIALIELILTILVIYYCITNNHNFLFSLSGIMFGISLFIIKTKKIFKEYLNTVNYESYVIKKPFKILYKLRIIFLIISFVFLFYLAFKFAFQYHYFNTSLLFNLLNVFVFALWGEIIFILLLDIWAVYFTYKKSNKTKLDKFNKK